MINFLKYVLNVIIIVLTLLQKNILNSQNNIFIFSVLEVLHMHKKVKKIFYNVLNAQTDFKNNNIF